MNVGNFKDYSDNTIKSVYDIDKKIIEISILYNKDDRDVVCVPTHHFCNLGCKMCHLTNNKLNKKMIPINIDDFMLCLKETLTKFKRDKKKLLISFMGVGEPLLNIKLIEDLYKREDEIKKLGYDHIAYSISTMMPNKNIGILKEIVNTNNIPLKIHFSLHTPINEERKKLIPCTNVDVDEALSLLKNYEETISKNNAINAKYKVFHNKLNYIEIHYTLIKNINDSNKELKVLIDYLSKYLITIKFIKFNPTNTLDGSLNETKWVNTLKKTFSDLRVKVYSPPGREVGSSCGQFTKHYYHEEIETPEELEKFNEWKRKHLI